MNYAFPHITHLSEILDAIAGSQADEGGEFAVARRPWGTVVQYLFMYDQTFPDPATAPDERTARRWALRRECRGIVFDPQSGDIRARRYHKFFTVGQRPETERQHIDLSRPHVMLDKLDGSMVSPVPVLGGGHLWLTKMGESDAAKQASAFVQSQRGKRDYEGFAKAETARGRTPIFEFMADANRIVVAQPEPQLVLTAVRDIHTGAYATLDDMRGLGDQFGVPVVGVFQAPRGDLGALLEAVRTLKNAEGCVVRFDSGHMLKLKGEWYLQLHGAKDALAHEKDVVAMVLADNTDDVLGILPAQGKAQLQAFHDGVLSGIAASVQRALDIAADGRTRFGDDRKSFAGWLPGELKRVDATELMDAVFAAYGGGDPKAVRERIVRRIENHLGSGPRVALVRGLWGGQPWVPLAFEDDAA